MSHDPDGKFPKTKLHVVRSTSHDPNGEFQKKCYEPPKITHCVPSATRKCVYCAKPAEHPVLALCLPCDIRRLANQVPADFITQMEQEILKTQARATTLPAPPESTR